MEYRKTRDILHVKEILGHKSLNNTMLYTQLISFKDERYAEAKGGELDWRIANAFSAIKSTTTEFSE